MVLGVTEQNAAVQDTIKLTRLQQLLVKLVEASGTNVAVSYEQVEGPVHHERRLHQLLLADDVQVRGALRREASHIALPRMRARVGRVEWGGHKGPAARLVRPPHSVLWCKHHNCRWCCPHAPVHNPAAGVEAAGAPAATAQPAVPGTHPLAAAASGRLGHCARQRPVSRAIHTAAAVAARHAATHLDD